MGRWGLRRGKKEIGAIGAGRGADGGTLKGREVGYKNST